MTDHTSAIAPRADLDELTAHFLRLFPSLDEKDQNVALALYRSLSQGEPVSVPSLASAVRLPEDDVIKRLSGWPGVHYDKSRRVIGFWGLTIMPMPHRLRINGIALYAWCAWDTLFLPELIGGTLDVASTCRGTGQAVRLTATPSGVQQADPADVVLSFLIPDSDRMNADVITSFCHYVHFFRTPQAALSWLAEHRDSFLLSLADAYALGRRINSARYYESLLRRAEVSTNGFFPHVGAAPG
jgi:alkylmercury lyase